MATGKKFYWLKLSRDFFKRHDIRIIEEQPNGKDYILFYLKLLVESIDHEGALRFSDTIPYDEKMLSVISNTNIDIVRSAIRIFTDLKLMEIYDDKTIYLHETQKMLGYETDWAFKQRQYREQKQLSHTAVDTLSPPCPPIVRQEIEKELEIDIEQEKESGDNPPVSGKVKPSKHQYGENKNVLLTDDEYERLAKDYPNESYPTVTRENLIECLSNKLAISGRTYKSHNLVIRDWVANAVIEKRVKDLQAQVKTARVGKVVQDSSKYDR